MQDFKRLRVWQDGRALTVAIHEATRTIRPGQAPELRSQLMRASMSISATVAEGAGRETRADFARFISMAIASASEVEHHLQVCDDLGLVERALVEQLVDRVTRHAPHAVRTSPHSPGEGRRMMRISTVSPAVVDRLPATG